MQPKISHPYRGLKLTPTQAEAAYWEATQNWKLFKKEFHGHNSPRELWAQILSSQGVSYLELLYWTRQIFYCSRETLESIEQHLGPKDSGEEKRILGIED